MPTSKEPQDFMEIGGSPVPGITLRQRLRGRSVIHRIAWSPNGRLLASPSDDKTIRIWDVECGECVAVRGTTMKCVP
jgi:WD40 repeat protein